MRKKIVTVIGARPQFIKAGALSPILSKVFDEVLVHTGQHHDQEMSGQFFEELGLKEPKYNLGVSGLTHGAMTGKMLEKIEEVLLQEKPDCLLVFGDTNSTLAGALAAAKLSIPIAHVEAGLRSYLREMPEEINRRLTDHLSTFLYCPSESSSKNLENEGIVNSVVVGDIMVDAAKRFLPNQSPTGKQYLLATLHRAENVDDPQRLKTLLQELGTVAKQIPVLLPLHPRTKKKVEEFSLNIPHEIELLPPQGYKEMLSLQKNATVVATDSGGVQKEAYFCETPCIILRNETEWTELVDHGYSTLLGEDSLLEKVKRLKGKELNWKTDLYGNGKTAEYITEHLHAHL